MAASLLEHQQHQTHRADQSIQLSLDEGRSLSISVAEIMP